MIIGIDGNEANVEKRVGISEYGFELLKKFEEFNLSKIKFQIYLKKPPLVDMPKERDGWKYKVIGPRRFWTQVGLPFNLFLHKSKPDIFFTPTHYAPRWCPVPTVVSIMDLSFIHFPLMFKKSDLYQLRNWTNYSIKKAKKVLTISQASKDDIIKIYKIPAKKVVVTYPGIKVKTNSRKVEMEEIRKKYKILGEYILFVGTLQPRKNIEKLVEAFSKLGEEDKKIELIVVGKRGWLFEDILNSPKKYGVTDKVKFLEFVSDQELETLYQNAICFILPSLYEGFGLPVLEAMKNGCPVITSNVSSLPEAGGDAALYVDPKNAVDIKNKIELLISDKKLRNDLVEKGYNQVKKFSWEKTAKETLKALEETAKL